MPARVHQIALIGVFIGLLGCDRFMESAPAFDIALHGPQLEGDSIEVSGSGSDVVFFYFTRIGFEWDGRGFRSFHRNRFALHQ